MPLDPRSAHVVAAALAEAQQRASVSERDLAPTLAHYTATLPAVCERWGLTAVGWLEGGAGMPTVDVRRPDGTPGVLKIAEPGELDAAARVMVAADGRGYAVVLDWDGAKGALLTERLGHDLWSEQTALDAQARTVAALLLDAWQVPLTHGKPFEGKAAQLLRILDQLGPRYGTGHEAALRLARHHAAELARTEEPEVVCHGDPHGGNVLRRGAQWALVDPDGFVGERAYDLGVVLRDACREVVAAEESDPGAGVALLRAGCDRLAARADTDAERVWRWGFVERVTTGLYLAWHGYPEQARTFLDTASLVARQG